MFLDYDRVEWRVFVIGDVVYNLGFEFVFLIE